MPGIFMLRMIENIRCASFFYQQSALHDRNMGAQLTDNVEVVGDKHHADAGLRVQLLQLLRLSRTQAGL